ncbi:MAG: GNAT family N-acetyltransferase [Acidobacteriota bacterium]|nr:GNAT family N-acetyltransferase [Acidobacteriota bacterium]
MAGETGADVTAPAAPVRVAGPGDYGAVGTLLHDFNREFGDPAPPPAALAERIGLLVESDDTVVLVAGDPPLGVAVLRFRPAIFTTGLECSLAELYVVPDRRGRGTGRALMETSLRLAVERDADTMEICVDEPDTAARRLYESLGFTNRIGGPGGPAMFFYERDLRAR